jgi:nucleotide-binding universal stress UspA family protein
MTLYKHIIVPLDGSSLSAQALPAARMVAQASGAEMTLVRAYTAGPNWHADAGHGRYTGSMAAAEHDRVVAYLKGEKLRLERFGFEGAVHVLAREEPPVEFISGLASQDPDALIVMSTHGRSGLTRMMTGSVTSRVVRAVSNPTLTVRCGDDDNPVMPEAFEHIIVPLDGSPFAEAALDHAAEMALLFGARVTLCQATHDAGYFATNTEWGRLNGEAGFQFGTPSDMAMKMGELSVDYLNRCAADLSLRFGLRDLWVMNLQDDPPDAIVKVARDLENSMVVMTTHGRKGMGRALLGSVADQVVRLSPSPTLLVRCPVMREAHDLDRAEEVVGAAGA